MSNLKPNELDINNMGRIKALMELKGYTSSFSFQGINNYFNNFSNVIDIPLSYIINDEISNVLHRGPIHEILHECIECKSKNIDIAVDDIKDLFVNRADFLIGSLLLDFNINAFSTFEYWMCNAYDKIKNKYPSSGKKHKKLLSKINKYNKFKEDNPDSDCPEILDEIMRNCGNYVSSMEKIEFVLSKVNKEYEPYKTYKEDLELIKFLSKVRNTVHTAGYNKTNINNKIEVDGNIYYLNSGQGFTSESHADSILLWKKIVYVYTYVFAFIGDKLQETNDSWEDALYEIKYTDNSQN
ncbi:TPA: hypothetical protein ACPUE9_003201 [Proteus mirabilis]|uniref:hypothetical protein n=1 Tax=Proteus mirabilis TaxID=584 RepID=UPI000D143244|nr:hypothetical protein [Proteus mirabilis]AZG97501.1 hypothetical protein EHQ66_02515 [Proteus mirabilis]MCI9767084.1 hypothetical protein [Proteus mirabilis]MCI9770671.1 hypothetical protein [Proteus mirabilis]MCI9774266.1 hypothetical protein [Proteus mirabilis]MDM3593369.1 hypothetical protein [Proteus mirabilis]